MGSKIKAALFAPYPSWPLIAAAGLGPAILAAGVARELLLPAVIVALSLQIVVFGRILSQILPERESAFWGILREHSLRYVIVGLLAIAVGLALRMVVTRVVPRQFPYVLINGVIQGAVAIITIYVWPLVFLRRSSLAAIVAGVSYLARNIASSLWIVGVVAIGQIVQVVGKSAYLEHRSGWGFAILLVAGVAFVYLGAVSYAAALHALIDVRIVESPVEA